MNKKLTLLEAFAKVKDRLEIWDCSEESDWEEYGTGYYECEEELDIIEKSLKALEIIKKRECLFKGLNETTQEEYDILKEVLNDSGIV